MRQRYLANVFAENIDVNPAGQANHVFLEHDRLEPIFKKVIAAIRDKTIKKAIGKQQFELAKEAGVITAAEAKKLMAYDKQLMEIIHVDHFEEKELIRVSPELKKPAAKKKAVTKKPPIKES
jgi:hypothetical protein